MIRDKETGEIRKLHDGFITLFLKDENQIDDPDFIRYRSIKELCDKWEDVPEKPKEYWYLDCYGMVLRALYSGNEWDERRKLIGNYFLSREEAEKAVKKLKALTKAKEDGLKIKGYYYNHEDLVILADIGKCNKLTLDTLFGKEID